MADISYSQTPFVQGSSVPPWNAAAANAIRSAVDAIVHKANRGAAVLNADEVGGVAATAIQQKELTAAPGTPWGTPTIYLRDTLRAAVEAASGGRNTVLYDDLGNPSYMVVIPKFRLQDIHADFGTGVHPAFIVDAVEKPYLFVGQVAGANLSSRACSIPGRDPWTSVNFDAAKTGCTAKGTGWHLMSAWEWAALSLWCLKNGFQPRGNTNYGQAPDALHETAPRQDNLAPGTASGTARHRGGLGPMSWRHDNSPVGVADLVGNVWEWNDGLKLVDGQFLFPTDNNYGLAEGSWPASGVYLDSTGTTGTDDVATANGAPILSASRAVPSDDCGNGLGSSAPDYDYTTIAGESGARSVTMSAGYDALALATRQKMMQLLVAHKLTQATALPYSTKGYIAARNYGERLPIRGGYWSIGANAGLAALDLNSRRSLAGVSVGFRPAFLP